MELTLASASQNLNTKKERVIHRLIPMLLAENILRILEYRSGKEIPRVDLWNCIGMRMDQAFRDQHEFSSRRDFSSALLADKYSLLKEFGINSEKREIIRDDDDSTKYWLNQRLKELISKGTIYVRAMEVDICSDCNYLQSLSGLHKNTCTLCGSKNFHRETKEVLLVDIPEDKSELIRGHIIHPKNTKHIRSFFDQLPPKMMISKVREYGLSLDQIGLEGYVLDPKIGVALMPELVAKTKGASKLTLIQGATVATHALPYTAIMTSGFQHEYVLLPKIPVTNLEEASNLGMGFVGRYLPFILMEYNENMTRNQLETAREEYLQINQRIDNIFFGLRSVRGPKISLLPEDNEMLSQILLDFSKYNVREARRNLNVFFRSQGRRYSEELRGRECHLNPNDLETLENIVRLFYK